MFNQAMWQHNTYIIGKTAFYKVIKSRTIKIFILRNFFLNDSYKI
jgi:hypothetical protein